MTEAETLERVRAVMIETFRLRDDVVVTRETTSLDVDGWDSLSHALLIMHVEEAFGTDLPLERTYALANVGELADLIRETLAERESGTR